MFTKISSEVQEFIRQHIQSVTLLELLLTMKAAPQRNWCSADISAEMRTNAEYASAQLAILEKKKLIKQVSKDCFRYDEKGEHHIVVEKLEEEYNSHRPTVINYIYSQPIDSIRGFADAFKIKKD